MVKIGKIFYLKELREGHRLVGLLIIFTLFLMCNYFDTFIFISLIILVPTKFLNLIWLNRDEFLFFYLNSRNSIKEIIISRKISVFLELNILLCASFYVFKGFIDFSYILILNIFILVYFIVSDFLFYYSFRKYIFQSSVNFFILVIFGQITLFLILYSNSIGLNELNFLIFPCLLIAQFFSFKFLLKNIDLNKYINI